MVRPLELIELEEQVKQREQEEQAVMTKFGGADLASW